MTLDMSEITEQAIMHTLTLLQSPMPADLIQQSTAFPAVKSRIKQTDLSQSQQPKIQLANSSNSAPADQAVTSNPAGQRGPSISAQPTLEHVVLDSTEQQISADALSSQAMLLASPDVQATTDASDSPMQSAAVSGATEAGGARDTTESNAAQASSQPVPETPGLLNMKAGAA